MAKQRKIDAFVLVLFYLVAITYNVCGTSTDQITKKTVEPRTDREDCIRLIEQVTRVNDTPHNRLDVPYLIFRTVRRSLQSYNDDNVSKNLNLERLRFIRETVKIRYGPEQSIFLEDTIKLPDRSRNITKIRISRDWSFTCISCKFGAGLLQLLIKIGKSDEEILGHIYRTCVIFKIQSKRVCRGVTELLAPEIIHILRQVKMSPKEICGYIADDSCDDSDVPKANWLIELPHVQKPPVKTPKPPIRGAPILKVLHISDIHYDPNYHEGTNALCQEPLCCHLENGFPTDISNAAGRWGDYRTCDTPKRTIDNMLRHIKSKHCDINYIIWTGDLPPHDVWNQTVVGQQNILRCMVSQLRETFPGIPIFPALGNHDNVRVNSFPNSDIIEENNSIKWLYQELDQQWKKLLPSSLSRTIRHGAFYSVLVARKFRIISLNTNYCNNKNLWLMINSTDPLGELQWLVCELQNAEFKGEKVHIIGHIPPGHADCLAMWSRNYYDIVNRYESTITGQFFGHTHQDEFQLFYDRSNLDRATNVAYIGPSVTPYLNMNPGYRIYHIDGNHRDTTRLVVDHENWFMNLDDANLYDKPVWKKLYSAREAYHMSSLLPKDWDIMVNRMRNDTSLFDLYYKHYYKDSPIRPECPDLCRKRLICDLLCGRSHDREYLCQRLEKRENS